MKMWFTPEQFDRCIRTSGEGSEEDHAIFGVLQQFDSNWKDPSNVMVSSGILFVDQALWGYCNFINLTYLKYGLLIRRSLGGKNYLDWRENQAFIHILQSMRSLDPELEEVVKEARTMECGGLGLILHVLISNFIAKAQDAIAGAGEADKKERESAAKAIKELRQSLAKGGEEFMRSALASSHSGAVSTN